MRIGLEMFGTQTSGRHRGVGRYCANFAAALRDRGAASGHEFVFYAVDGLPTDLVPEGPNAVLRAVRPEPHLRYTLNRLARTNPDGLDALVLVNPLELNPGNDIPPRPPRGALATLGAVVHDLIPLIFQDRYLRRWPGESFGRRYLWALDRLRGYDLLLANSEATRADVVRLLNVPPGRVVAVGAAGDDRGAGFGPAPAGGDPADAEALRGLGVVGPFVFAVAAPDPRKNLGGLVDAFALLPPSLRAGHRLVVAVGSEDDAVAAVRRRADELGVLGSLALLNRPVDDPTLRALYRGCAAFAFPSLYEGFGLPVLEALSCGAAVVAGDHSSLPEVAGGAALLVDTADPSAFAGALARVLTDGALAGALRSRGPARAGAFSWAAVADRTLGALAGHARPKGPRAAAPRPERPRVAMFSPLPPDPSGVATYAGALAEALGEPFAVDLFHEARAYPYARFRSGGAGVFDHRVFGRVDRVRPYHAVVYQMGNSPAHAFAEAALRARPGVVVLHDAALGAYQYEKAVRSGGGRAAFRAALAEAHPGRAAEFDAFLAGWDDAPEAMVRGLTAAGFDMNGGIVARADAVIVHSREALGRLGLGAAGKGHVVPLGAEVADRPEGRARARARLGLAAEAVAVGCFGIVHPSKLNAEAVEAFAGLAGADPGAVLLVVGAEADGGLARRRAEGLGLGGRVRFLGRPDDAGYLDLIAGADLGVALRRPPTNGESSAALLDLLRHGVPTVVTDTGSFAEFPEGAVRKVRWDDDARGVAALARALIGLASDPDARAALGRAGRNHVRDHHAWPKVAAGYAGVIARVRPGALRGPHRAGAHRPEPSEPRYA